MEVPTNFFTFAVIFPWATSTLAPNASKAFICWSIGLAPKLQPPGRPTSALLHLPNKEPSK